MRVRHPGTAHFDTWSLEELPDGAAPARGASWSAGQEARELTFTAGAALALIVRLRAARERLLQVRARDVARLLGSVGARFLEPADPLREEALRLLPPSAGISREMARAVLDGMAADWQAPRLQRLLDEELDGGAPLDGFVDRGQRRVRALGRALTVHVCAGTVPGVSVTSLVRALLVKSAVLLKPGRGDEVLPVLFRRGLEEAAPGLAPACAVLYWPGGGGELERVALGDADLAVVYGGEAAVAAVRGAVVATTPVVAYPHRLSFAVIGQAALAPERLEATARDAALAVALFDQRGCVSPHVFYVLGSMAEADALGDALAAALARLERELPAGRLDPAEGAALQQLRGTAELRAADGRARLLSGGGAAWTVVVEPEADFQPSCLGRTVRVKPAWSCGVVIEAVQPFRRYLQTVGVIGLAPEALAELAEGLARLGVVRVAPLARAPWPPAWWHHDGMGPLQALVRWTDWEDE